jgi:hypothetical protein
MPQCVRSDTLVDPSPASDAPYNPGCTVAIESLPVAAEQDWPLDAFADAVVRSKNFASACGTNGVVRALIG